MSALKDFDKLYDIADNQTRKVLLRSLIKKIEMNKDRKTINSITLWFEEGNTPSPPPPLFFDDGFPVSEVQRTVS